MFTYYLFILIHPPASCLLTRLSLSLSLIYLQTRFSLLYEASIGQIVPIDCHVIANPSKSVHYSWFFSPIERNLSNWMQRDIIQDEQIDESR